MLCWRQTNITTLSTQFIKVVLLGLNEVCVYGKAHSSVVAKPALAYFTEPPRVRLPVVGPACALEESTKAH